MPSRNREPGDGQISIDGTAVRARGPVDPDRTRNALSRTLTPEYMGLKEDDFMDVTVPMIEFVRPDNLRGHLIDVPMSSETSPFAVSYDDRKTNQTRYIAVTPREARVLPRYMGALQRHAVIASRGKVTNLWETEADIARGNSSRIQVQEGKLPGVLEYKSMLTGQSDRLQKFITASNGRNVGLSMFGKESSMRAEFAYLQTFIIGDMVRAYGAQRRLGETDTKMVEKAITTSIYFGPRHIETFHNLMIFLKEYNAHKTELADQRIEAMVRNIGKNVVSK